MFDRPSQRPLHVVVLPSWVGQPNTRTPEGFFKDQALALQHHGVRVGYVCVGQRSLRDFSLAAARETHFQVSWQPEDGVWTMRMHAWNTFADTITGSRLWARLCGHLLARYIRCVGRPDVIHAHCTLWAGHGVRGVARRFGIPYVVTEHSSGFLSRPMPEIKRRFVRAVVEDASCVLAVGSRLRDRLQELSGCDRVRVLPNVVSTAFFSLPEHPRPSSPFRLVFIGHLTPRKSVDILLRALSAICRGGDYRLDIVGSGPELPALQSLAKDLGIAAYVRFLGAMGKEQIRDVLWRSNGLVLPSRWETFGVVLIEAMATGLPVVSTRCGGPSDIVEPGTGILIEPGDVDSLALAIRRLAEERYDPHSIRESVVRRFSEARIAESLIAVYNEVLGPPAVREAYA